MKIWRTFIMAVLLGSSMQATAGMTDRLCGLEVSVKYLYWKPFNSQLPWAKSIVNNPDKPLIRTFYLQPDYQSGIGIEARYQLPCSCWSALARYHWVRPTADAQLALEPSDAIFTIYESAITQIFTGGRADSKISMPYHAAEALVGYTFSTGNCFELTPLAGVAFFSVQRNYSDLIVPPAGQPTQFGRGRLYNRFAGAGPVIGLGASTSLWCGLRGYGECLLSGTIGRKKNSELFSQADPNSITAVQLIAQKWASATSFVPGITCRLGGSWGMDYWCARWALNLGWEQRIYFNVTEVPVSNTSFPNSFLKNLILGGPTLGASISF